jgi:hypothetical protein
VAVELIQLDRSLREWGAETRPARELLRTYTAAAIATTWTGEPKPPGDYYPTEVPTKSGWYLESSVMGDMLEHIEHEIRELEPHDAMRRRLSVTCIAQFERLMQTHWRIIEETGSSISTPFYVVLVFWLTVVFASFGLNAPRNILSYTVIALGGLAIASAYLSSSIWTPHSAGSSPSPVSPCATPGPVEPIAASHSQSSIEAARIRLS